MYNLVKCLILNVFVHICPLKSISFFWSFLFYPCLHMRKFLNPRPLLFHGMTHSQYNLPKKNRLFYLLSRVTFLMKIIFKTIFAESHANRKSEIDRFVNEFGDDAAKVLEFLGLRGAGVEQVLAFSFRSIHHLQSDRRPQGFLAPARLTPHCNDHPCYPNLSAVHCRQTGRETPLSPNGWHICRRTPRMIAAVKV